MASKNTSTPVTVNEAEAALHSAFDGLTNYEDVDPAQAALDIAKRIMDGDTVDDILGVGESTDATHAEDVIGIPFTIHEVTWQKSNFNQGLPVYSVAHVTNLLTGQRDVVTCSATNVCSAFLAIQKKGLLPVDVKYVRSDKATAAGFWPLWLRKVTEADLSNTQVVTVPQSAEEPF